MAARRLVPLFRKSPPVLTQIFSIVAPVFACAGIGYGWARSGRSFDTDMVTTMMVYVATPCLVFSALANADLTPAAFFATVGYAALSLVVFGVIGFAVLKAFRVPVRGFLAPLIFANAGNMGLPLCLLAFGKEGLALAISYFTVCALAQFTFGPALAAGTVSLREAVRNPLLYAVMAALAFMIPGAKPPAWLFNVTHLIGGMAIPLMLVTLGVSLGRLKMAGAGRGAALSALRLGMGFSAGWAIAQLFGLDGALRGVIILEGAMPVAVFNYLFAQRYGAYPEEVAGMVMMSTAMSMVTLPLLIWFVL